MVWLAIRQLVSRRAATGVAALGLLTATLGFILLASTSRTTEAVLRGDLARAWPSPYDLLVRPLGSRADLEIRDALVRPNFLSGLKGGITVAQLNAIRAIPGVEVAAPIAVIGFVDWPAALPFDLGDYVGNGPLSAFRVNTTFVGDAGMSRYPLEPRYLLVAPEGELGPVQNGHLILKGGGRTLDCTKLNVGCLAPKYVCPPQPNVVCGQGGKLGRSGLPLAWVNFSEPIVIAAVDPDAENALTGLARCVTSGLPLVSDDRPVLKEIERRPGSAPQKYSLWHIPVLVSEHAFIDESIQVQLDRAMDPTPIIDGGSAGNLTPWQSAVSRTTSADEVYRDFLDTVQPPYGVPFTLWVPSDVQYHTLANGRLAPTIQPPNFSVLDPPPGVFMGSEFPPIEAKDVWFRSLTAQKYRLNERTGRGLAAWEPIGRYDPGCIAGFNALAGRKMETYALPQVELPDGRRLGPTRSMTGYINSPPLLLTTLAGAAFFADPNSYLGAPDKAFISAIRVRVTGIATPGPVAEARLSRVAAEIHDMTGLAVDIVRGSSARTVQVDLPAGNFGRPALTVKEGWSVIGVAFRFTKAVSAQNLGMFALVLLGATLLVGETAYIAVRRRRREFGMLRAVGWPVRRIAWLVEVEMLILALGVGLLALVVGIPLALLLKLGTSTWQVLAAVPLAVAIAAVASLLPAVAAVRGTTVRVMQGGGKVHRSRPPGSMLALALRELAGPWRGEAALGIGAVALGCAMLGGVVLLMIAFRGQLDATILGTYLAGRVRPFHLVMAILTVGVGALAAGEIVTLGYLERQVHLATLRALGWPRRSVVQLLVLEAVILGCMGGLIGALWVAVGGIVIGATVPAIVIGVSLGSLVAVGTTLLAVAGPAFHAYRSAPGEALKGE